MSTVAADDMKAKAGIAEVLKSFKPNTRVAIMADITKQYPNNFVSQLRTLKMLRELDADREIRRRSHVH